MKILKSNFKSGKINFRLLAQVLIFLCAFAGNSAAQDDFELLAEKIRRGNTEQKRDALWQIRNLESETASRLAVPALRDSAEIVRATAAFSVVFLPSEEAAGVLLPLLSDKKELVRREAAYALGKVRNPQAVSELLRVLKTDKILEVRAASAVALGEIGDAAAIETLIEILQRKLKDEEEFLRRSAARSVGQIAQIIQTGNPKVVTPENFLPTEYDRNKKLKYADLIAAFPVFRAANDVLKNALQNKNEFADVKREAAFALGAIGDESAIAVLRANTQATDYYLAEIAKEALRKIEAAKSSSDLK